MTNRLLRFSLPFALVIALLAAPSRASAQAPSTGFGLGAVRIPGTEKGADRTKGLRFGRSVFHAGLTLEGGWDSNVFYSSGSATSSAYLRLMPQLSLGTQTEGQERLPSVVYEVNLGLDYVAYLQDISANEKARHQIGAVAGASVLFNPQGAFRFGLSEQFTRTNEPRAGVDFGYNRDYNSVGFDLTINPGRGLITILVGYRFVLDYFEDPNDATGANELAAFNAFRHEARVKASWRFFPKTSFWLDVQTGYNDYIEDFNVSGIGSIAGGNRSSVPLKVMLGVTGRLTPKLTADLGIGYRAYFYMDQLESQFPGVSSVKDDQHDVAAHVGVGWQIAPTAVLNVGYQHDSVDSIVGDYYKADSAYLSVNLGFFQRLELRFALAWTLANYKGLFYQDTTGSMCTPVAGNVSSCKRHDNYLLASVNASYYILSWLSVGLGYQLLANASDFNATYTGGGTTSVQDPSFFKHRVFALVNLYY